MRSLLDINDCVYLVNRSTEILSHNMTDEPHLDPWSLLFIHEFKKNRDDMQAAIHTIFHGSTIKIGHKDCNFQSLINTIRNNEVNLVKTAFKYIPNFLDYLIEKPEILSYIIKNTPNLLQFEHVQQNNPKLFGFIIANHLQRYLNRSDFDEAEAVPPPSPSSYSTFSSATSSSLSSNASSSIDISVIGEESAAATPTSAALGIGPWKSARTEPIKPSTEYDKQLHNYAISLATLLEHFIEEKNKFYDFEKGLNGAYDEIKYDSILDAKTKREKLYTKGDPNEKKIVFNLLLENKDSLHRLHSEMRDIIIRSALISQKTYPFTKELFLENNRW